MAVSIKEFGGTGVSDDFTEFLARETNSKKRSGLSAIELVEQILIPPQPRRVEISPEQYCHGEPPSFATLNQNRNDLGIAKESRFQGLGISSI